jgi:hypothetical protein
MAGLVVIGVDMGLVEGAVIASVAKQSSPSVIESQPTCSGDMDGFASLAMTGDAVLTHDQAFRLRLREEPNG